MALLVCANKDESHQRMYDGKVYAEIDASIVATHMMLQAAELGLGTTWVGNFDPIAVHNAFNIPSNIEPVCIFPIGYQTKDAKVNPNHTKRKSLSETILYNHF